jgi:hypothetical protein
VRNIFCKTQGAVIILPEENPVDEVFGASPPGVTVDLSLNVRASRYSEIGVTGEQNYVGGLRTPDG